MTEVTPSLENSRFQAFFKITVLRSPAIRTAVFLKGCPLRCAWCHNPESQNPHPEIFSDGAPCGRQVSVSEVLDEVLRDRDFYADIGGMTLSGGEPLFQHDFALELLMQAKEAGLHTAVETCGHTERIEDFIPYVDLWLYDIKLTDTALHRKWTGLGNELILKNLQILKDNVVVRCPIIDGVNLTRAHLQALQNLGRPLEFLLYHPLGIEKAKRLGRSQPYAEPHFLEKEKLLSIFPDANII